jgi:2-polyprenyl-3-methyl-5-hydroxy-6-metoxy-1,4-benzoquinol methylase
VTPAFSSWDRNRRLSYERFRYVRCRACGTVGLAHPPADLAAFYRDDYYEVPSTRDELLATLGPAEREKLALVQRHASSGRLLEIGPSRGAFLAVAQQAGYDVEAIELDEACCVFLRSELGIEAQQSDDPAAAIRGRGPFDAIVMWHVIEHLADPAGVLAACARELAPGGLMVLATPNPQSLQLQLLRGRWFHVDAPRHLCLIPVDTVISLSSAHGVDPVLATCDGPSAIDYARGGWCESLANGAGAAKPLRLLGVAALRLFAPIERRDTRGATYTVLLRKRRS